MSGYCIRNDGLGWRTVDVPTDCYSDETWQEAQPPIVVPPVPDPSNQTIAPIPANAPIPTA